jgi:hypothetical protein
MKTYSLLFLFSFSVTAIHAQITVDQDDFADPLDTARMSVAIWNPLLDFGATGPNYSWDFSGLQWQSQYIDTFLSTLFTHPVYSFTFSNTSFNRFRSNIAQKADNTLTTFPFLSNIFTDGYNFFYKNQNVYSQKGMGMRVSGFPTAVPMMHFDTIYKFPMDFGNEDSSWSDYTVHIPQIGLYSHQQHRVNKVDGWGTLTTPFGTFDVLRQVSDIRGYDSLYIDTLNFGFRIDADIQRQYKWIGKNQKEPLLQINTQAGILGQFQGFEFVTKIVYRDSVRFITTGIANASADEIQFRIFPNPSAGNFMIISPPGTAKQSLRITDISGRTVFLKEDMEMAESIDASAWERGIYFVALRSGHRQSVQKVAIQ